MTFRPKETELLTISSEVPEGGLEGVEFLLKLGNDDKSEVFVNRIKVLQGT